MRSSSQHFEDEECVYANLSEIAKRELIEYIDRRPNPPIPMAGDRPIRITANGWREYKTLGGRSFYFHSENSICQWKPPRNTVSVLQKASNSMPITCEASTSTNSAAFQQSSTSTELFAEIPLSTNGHEPHQQKLSYIGGCDLTTICEGEAYPIHHHSIVVDHDGRDYDDNSVLFRPLENKRMMSHSIDGPCIRSKNGLERSNTAIEIQTPPFPQFLPPFPINDHQNSLSTHGNLTEGKAIRHGQLEKCKITENGIRLKKREWISVYAYLYTGHLLFYKDQKSAKKMGKHYPAPSDVCDLRNAIVSFGDNEREKRRKRLISLLLYSKTEYLFACTGDDQDEVGWFSALRQAITLLSPTKVYPHPIISDYCGSLHRSSTRTKSAGSHSTSKSSLHSSIKSKLKTGVSPDKIEPTGTDIDGAHPTRESIIERLLRFFRSRPSMESLRERGIYKPEPVFGSTLAEITAHEKSQVPKFIYEVTRLIETKGLEVDGLYRVNGNLSAVQRIRCQVDQDKYEALRTEEDVHVLTGALKLFLRELSEPIFPQSSGKEFMSAIREPNTKQKFRTIDELLLRLPLVNKETLKVLIIHLERVATHSGKNRMQIHNLAIIFGPSLFCAEERIQGGQQGGGRKATGNDKTGKMGKRKPNDKKGGGFDQTTSIASIEPNQNLAYKMIVYGQIVEFILNEARRLAIFKENSSSNNHQQQHQTAVYRS